MLENNNLKADFSNRSGSTFDPKDFVFKYLRYLPLIFLGVVIASIVAFVKIRYATPIFNVTGSLFINKETKSGGGRTESLEDMFLFSNNVNLKNELEILTSRPLIQRVVKSLGLEVSYYNKGKFRSSNIYGYSPVQLEIVKLRDASQSFQLAIEVSNDKFKFVGTEAFLNYDEVFENAVGVFKLIRVNSISLEAFSSNVFNVNYVPAKDAAAGFASSIKAMQTIDQATILDLSMATDNINLGKDLINKLMQEYGTMNVEEKRQISRITMQFIDERLDTIRNELGGVESGLLTYRQKNDIVDLQEQSKLYFESLTENNKELISQQVQIGVIDYLLNYVNNPANEFKIVPTDLGIQEATLLPLLSQYNSMQLQRTTLVHTSGPSSSNLLRVENMLSTIRQQILEALKNVKQAYGISGKKLRDEIIRSQTNIKTVPAKAKGLLDIERQQKIKQDLYLFLMQKREEAAISAAATVSSSKPLEEATASNSPVEPNKKNIYLLYLFVGVAIPIAIIALIELLNDKITEKEEIGKQTETPIIGEIGHSKEETLIVSAGSRTVIAEQFRIMRTNVQYLINKIEKPVILITSSVSGEGKSFVATNYGAATALTGKKTVILEFDIRKPRLLKGLEMTGNKKGLTNFILGEATIEEIIQPVKEFSNLYVIGCGPIPPNPSELLLDNQVSVLFGQLKKQFDAIIIDTAPVGLVSDAFTLSAFADATLYIVRQGYTIKKQLANIQELYMQRRLRNMGLVINDIQTKGRYSGYYGYGQGAAYGYGYGYGGEYFQKDKKRDSFMSRVTSLFFKNRI